MSLLIISFLYLDPALVAILVLRYIVKDRMMTTFPEDLIRGFSISSTEADLRTSDLTTLGYKLNKSLIESDLGF